MKVGEQFRQLRDRVLLEPVKPTDYVRETVQPGRRGIKQEAAYNIPVGKRRYHSFMMELTQDSEMPKVYRSRIRRNRFIVDAPLEWVNRTVDSNGQTYPVQAPRYQIDAIRLGLSGNYMLPPMDREYKKTHVRVRGDIVIGHVLADYK